MITDDLRRLLDSYYSGVSTPEEEETLRRYFSDNNVVDSEFEADAAIFRAISDLGEIQPPSGLEQRLISATVGRRRPFGVLMPVIGIAASIAVVLCLGVFLMQYKDADRAEVQSVVAFREEGRSVVADTVSMIPDIPHTIASAVVEESKEPVSAGDQTSESHNGYKEVTDPEEAARIIEEIFAKLAIQMDDIELGARKADMAVAMARNPLEVLEIKKEYKKYN